MVTGSYVPGQTAMPPLAAQRGTYGWRSGVSPYVRSSQQRQVQLERAVRLSDSHTTRASRCEDRRQALRRAAGQARAAEL